MGRSHTFDYVPKNESGDPRTLAPRGGGIAGIAWRWVCALGIEEKERGPLRLLAPIESTFIGTSAGSVVASHRSPPGSVLCMLFDQQLEQHSPEVGAARSSTQEFQETLARLLDGVTSAEEGRRRVGRFCPGCHLHHLPEIAVFIIRARD
jgi:hypothetical protein